MLAVRGLIQMLTLFIWGNPSLKNGQARGIPTNLGNCILGCFCSQTGVVDLTARFTRETIDSTHR